MSHPGPRQGRPATSPTGGAPQGAVAAASGSGRRADARRNRELILTAARAVYSTDGLTVSMAEVARRAGVGKATLFRHFPTQQDLVDAVFADRMADYVHAGEQALVHHDPWAGFVEYVTAVCAMQARDRGFADVLTLPLDDGGLLAQQRVAAYQGFLTILERAKATGHLRADFVSEDLVLVLMANAGVLAATAVEAPGGWARLVGQLLRGFAAPGAPLPALPPAPDSAELYRAMARESAPAATP